MQGNVSTAVSTGILLATLLSLAQVPLAAQGGERDMAFYATYSKLLADNVDANGMIDYAGFEKSPDFNDYLLYVARVDLGSMEKTERLALLINAYNAYVIKIVLDHFPVDSPNEIDGFFTDVRCSIGGMQLTLNELRQRYLLPLGGAFIYFGITFAAKGGPRLLPKPYAASGLQEQLQANAREFAANATKVRLEKGKKSLYLSEMFRWYDADFQVEFGSVRAFLEQYGPPVDADFLRKNPVEIRYMDFDWDLNLQRNI